MKSVLGYRNELSFKEGGGIVPSRKERKHLEKIYTETCQAPGHARTPLLSKDSLMKK